MSSIYNMFLDYEALINAVCMTGMLAGIFLSDSEDKPTKNNVVYGGITFLSFSTLALSVFVNIIEKGLN